MAYILDYRLLFLLTILLAGAVAAAQTKDLQCSSSPAVRDCYIQADELQSWQQRKDLVLLDTRNAAARKVFSIPQALHHPLYALKTKTYLKTRPLLLIGDGFHLIELERACLELQKAGFQKLRILRGGIHRWVASGGRLEGERSKLTKEQTVSAADVYSEMAGRSLLLLDISDKPARLSVTGRSRYLHVKKQVPLSALASQIGKRLREELKGSPDTSIVLFDDHQDKADSGELAQLIEQLKLDDIWLLKGGRQSLEAFARQNQKMLEHLAQQRPGRCG